MNRTYFLEHDGHFGAVPPISLLGSNIIEETGITSFTDTNANGAGPFCCRVGVQ